MKSLQHLLKLSSVRILLFPQSGSLCYVLGYVVQFTIYFIFARNILNKIFEYAQKSVKIISNPSTSYGLDYATGRLSFVKPL